MKEAGLQDINSDEFTDLTLMFDKPSLRSIVETNSELFIDDDRIYLFGTVTPPDSYFFFGSE